MLHRLLHEQSHPRLGQLRYPAESNPSNPPTVVRLVRYWSEITPPGGSHPPDPLHHFVFFIHFVSAGDLS